MNNENLIPFSQRTESEQREIARAGGIASGKARRRKRSVREAAELILSMPMGSGELQDLESIESFEKVDEDRLTVSEAIALRLVWMATSNIEYADRIRAIRTLMELCPSESEDVLVLTKDSITFEQAELILNTLDSEPEPLS